VYVFLFYLILIKNRHENKTLKLILFSFVRLKTKKDKTRKIFKKEKEAKKLNLFKKIIFHLL